MFGVLPYVLRSVTPCVLLSVLPCVLPMLWPVPPGLLVRRCR
ncbi:hypothetical protein [Streptomyces sp. CT34]|nr:hypothetical protein [Streptomyces sp. CT34]